MEILSSQSKKKVEKILSQQIWVRSFLKSQKVMVGQERERAIVLNQPKKGSINKGGTRDFART